MRNVKTLKKTRKKYRKKEIKTFKKTRTKVSGGSKFTRLSQGLKGKARKELKKKAEEIETKGNDISQMKNTKDPKRFLKSKALNKLKEANDKIKEKYPDDVITSQENNKMNSEMRRKHGSVAEAKYDHEEVADEMKVECELCPEGGSCQDFIDKHVHMSMKKKLLLATGAVALAACVVASGGLCAGVAAEAAVAEAGAVGAEAAAVEVGAAGAEAAAAAGTEAAAAAGTEAAGAEATEVGTEATESGLKSSLKSNAKKMYKKHKDFDDMTKSGDDDSDKTSAAKEDIHEVLRDLKDRMDEGDYKIVVDCLRKEHNERLKKKDKERSKHNRIKCYPNRGDKDDQCDGKGCPDCGDTLCPCPQKLPFADIAVKHLRKLLKITGPAPYILSLITAYIKKNN
jgi:hypothetical protein